MRVHLSCVERPGRSRVRRTVLSLLILLSCTACGAQVEGNAAPASVSVSTVTATVTVFRTVGGAPASGDTAGSAPSITPRQTNPDPCKLLTQAEATTLAGMDLQAGIGSGPENGANTLCTFTRDPNAGGTGQVSIVVGDGAKKTLDIDKDTLEHTFTKVAGIADEAWQEDGSIFVRKGAIWFTIALVVLEDDAVSVKPLQQAAKIAISRF